MTVAHLGADRGADRGATVAQPNPRFSAVFAHRHRKVRHGQPENSSTVAHRGAKKKLVDLPLDDRTALSETTKKDVAMINKTEIHFDDQRSVTR